MLERPRRLRVNSLVRDLVEESDLRLGQLIQPYFLIADSNRKEPISGFTEVYRWGIDSLSSQIERDMEFGVRSFLLFGAASAKDATGSEAVRADSLVPRALSTFRSRFGKDILLFTDVCLCPYTSHGHCGFKDGDLVLNDESLDQLSQMALMHAQAGADFVAPSDMMDGRVKSIRQKLDSHGFSNTGILSYTAKFASNYYGPFREALSSSPEAGEDRTTYQMDFRNRRESMRELRLDEAEGADMVMVKPALAYLDIISDFANATKLPVVAYSVSGEYEMVQCLAKAGIADERRLCLENLMAIRRAGARVIITYFAGRAAEKRWIY